MSTDRPNPSHLQRQRVPLHSKVSLKFKEFRGFITEYSQNISLGGMFLATDMPQPAGTVFDFEFKLDDEFSLIHGIGEVVWARTESQGSDTPAGMGVRFLHLDGAGEKLVQRMVREHVERGGIPFELGATEPGLGGLEDGPFVLSDITPPPPSSTRESSLSTEPETELPEVDALSSEGPLQLEELLKTQHLEIPTAMESKKPREFGNPLDYESNPLEATAVLKNPLAAGDPDPPSAKETSSPQRTFFEDLPSEPTKTPEAAPAPLPPGFDEVTRALGRRGPNVRYASAFEPSVSNPNDDPTSLPSPGVLQVAPVLRPSPPSGPWQVPDAIEPYWSAQEPPERKRRWVLGLGVVLLALALGAAYYYSQIRSIAPVFASEDQVSQDQVSQDRVSQDPVSGDQAGRPAPGAESSAVNPNAVTPSSSGGPNDASSNYGATPVAGDGEPPPSLESLVGLPEPTPAPTKGTSALPPKASEDSLGLEDSLSDPAPRPSGSLATRIEDITWSEVDRATVVTLLGNGNFSDDQVSTFRLQSGQPREVVRLRGIETGYRRPNLILATPVVQQMRMGHHEKSGRPELHIVFDLEHIDTKLFSVQAQGKELIITLGPT